MKVIVLLLLVAVAFALAEEHNCPANSHYDECGTACPATCDNYKEASDLCIKICYAGCHCNEGYVRIKEDVEECLKPEQCPATPKKNCPANSHYEECGTACPITCENYKDPPGACERICVARCFCNEGYVENEDGECVKPDRCASEEPNCVDKPDTGMCRGYFPMWYFDEDAVECKKFIYGGCDGNGNRYATKEECLRKCAHIMESESDRCSQPAETGLCRGYFPKFYFDKAEGQCKEFIYGGCGGNENNFDTKEECERACGNHAILRARNACEEDKEVGPCRAAFARFYFNKNTGKCEPFIYGGCQGNSNNFLSIEDCEAVCVY